MSFRHALSSTYGTKDYLISSVSAAAQGLFGSGWVWLTVDNWNQLGIIATHGAGTLLARSRDSLAPEKFSRMVAGNPTQDQPPQALQTSAPPPPPPHSIFRQPPSRLPGNGHTQKRGAHSQKGVLTNPVSQQSTLSHQAELRTGEFLRPLFCISVNEHAWLSSGYGIWGKKEYLKQFWTVLDWDRVAANHSYWNRSSESKPISG